MTAAYDYVNQLESVTCFQCGVVFAMPAGLRKTLLERREKQNFWCPNGHEQHYIGETDAQKLQKELDRERQRRQMAESTAVAEAKRAENAERLANRRKNQLARVENGVCPCCNRSFTNLRRHMATKHPEEIK